MTTQYRDLRAIIDAGSPTIVDGGANEGGSVERFLETFEDPRVHAFEPVPDCVDELEERCGSDDRVVVHPQALGPTSEEIPLHLTEASRNASVLEPDLPDEDHPDYSEALADEFSVSETITAEQVRLDDVVDERVDVLKLDLQGYELAALEGAEGLLDDCRAILCEVQFTPFYAGQPMFSDVDVHMRERDYRVYDLYEVTRGATGQLIFCNALYVNRNVIEPGQEGTDARTAGREG